MSSGKGQAGPAGGTLDFRILGSFEVRRDGEALRLGGHRQRSVLAILTLAANHAVSADSLIEQVWSGDPPPSATNTLQSYVSDLRRVLEPDRAPRAAAQVLRSLANGYLLAIPEGARDIDRFAEHTRLAQEALAEGAPARASEEARLALVEWRGPALADFGDDHFATTDILRLEEARLQVLELRIDADLAAGRHGAVVAELGAVVKEHPLRERVRGQLMLALYRSGRQADALEVAKVGRRQLAEELGIDPDPALQELELAILQQDPALLLPAAPTAAAATPAAVPAPAARVPQRGSDGGAEDGIVGRREEREVLGRALAAAGAGTGRVVLIGGEPGIGKTHLAEAFAADVAGALVLWGRCQETEGAPPFWPWRQVLRSLVPEVDDATLRRALGADAAVVLDVAPELVDQIGDVAPVRLPDAEAARFHFFDAVTRLLTSAARDRPLVIVLEDLHFADESTMALLRFVVGAVRGSGLLLVGTYRDVAVADRALLASTLGALAREPVVERLLLPGLDHDEGAMLVARLLGRDPDAGLVSDILERSGGNPLFLTHLVRLLQGGEEKAAGDARAIVREHVPPAVIDLIRLRVGEQPEGTRRLLEVAAVIGRSFELELLVQVEARTFDAALAGLEPAIRAGLVVEGEERFYEPETWMLRARLLGGRDGARTDLQRAVAAAEAAGAMPLLERARAALAELPLAG